MALLDLCAINLVVQALEDEKEREEASDLDTIVQYNAVTFNEPSTLAKVSAETIEKLDDFPPH